MDDYVIHHGDALLVLKTLPNASVHCVVTSPPYWGLRDYQVDHQIGLEKTPDEYVARLVEVFREVRRVLRDDGTLWLNIGDSYASGKGTCHNPGRNTSSFNVHLKEANVHPLDRGNKSTLSKMGLKPKDLVGIPWRVAFALQADGWYLRSEIIWAKRAPMPESVTDRPTRSHEQIFLLTKSARYFYDAEAVREPPADYDRKGGTAPYTADGSTTNGIGSNTLHQMNGNGRNQRDVWHLGPEPYPEAHFAVFPTEIPRRAILAGTSERGCCPACGAPWERVVERKFIPQPSVKDTTKLAKASNKGLDPSNGWGKTPRGTTAAITTDWRPSCTCPPADPIPCTVLDPFLGSGTTIAVAVGLGRRGVGIELSKPYIELAHRRISIVQRPLMLAGY